jgi:hypothetical protein
MCIIALALIEHDGLAALFGVLIGAVSILIVWGAFLAVLKAILLTVEHFAGV